MTTVEMPLPIGAQNYPEWAYALAPWTEDDMCDEVRLVETDELRGYLRPGGTIDQLTRPDERVERQVDLVVHRATVQHGQHQSGSHPHCVSCEERWLARRGPEWVLEARDVATARARAWLLSASLPKAPEPKHAPVSRSSIATPWPEVEEEGTDWIVKNLVPARRVGILFGPPGSMKSFLAFDLAATVATGAEAFHGHEVGTWKTLEDGDEIYLHPGRPVLYLPGEGRSGYFGRKRAWESARGQSIERDALHLGAWMPQLGDDEDFEELLAYVAEHRFSLVVVDTLSTASEGTEENSASEMGLVVNRCHALAEASGGTVLVVHHTGHDESRARGSSVLRANVDFMLKMKREEADLSCSVVKMKDGPDHLALDLTFQTVEGSLVLDVPARGIAAAVWRSSSLQDALWAFVKSQVDSGQGEPTLTALKQVGRDEHEASPTTVQRAVTDLVAQGLLSVRRDGKVNLYAPGPKSWPSQ